MSTTKADATSATAKRTIASAATPAAAAPVGLVQQLGNQGLEALLRARLVQAKLTVSHPQDSYEQEADRVADQVMRMPLPAASPPAGTVQRLPEGGHDVRRFSTASDVPVIDAATEQSIQSLSGRGSALPDSVRSFMEPRFGADFSTVRVHTDAHAHGLARSVNAQAFTVGRNVVFGAGHYAPHTESGKQLLAHELTHVLQQSSAPRLARKPLIDNPFKTERTIDDWANGSVDVGTLKPSELQPAIDELQEWVDRQNTSSFKRIRIEATLAALRAESSKRDLATKNSAHRPGGRGKGGKPAERPKISPRVLTEKNVSIAYASPAEARAEFDLIMQWLTIPGLERDKRLLLLRERANIESFLGQDRKRAASERYIARVRAALTSSDANPSDALKSVVRTIEGIGKDPENEEISYIYHQGERLAISTEQAVQLREDMTRTLSRAAFEIWEGIAQQSMRDRARQVKINEENKLESRVAEIFTGHLLSNADDPYSEMLVRNGDVFNDLRTLRGHIKAGRLTEAAGLLPHMEKRAREMADMAEKFTGTYIKGAERAVATFEITAKLAVSIELAIVTAGTASFVSGLVGTGGLGLTGVGAGVATTLGTGLGVGGITAVAKGGVSFGVSLATGHSLGEAWHDSKGEAIDGFWEGAVAGLTGGAGRVLAPALGVGANVGFQRARQAGAEAIVNATSSIVEAIKSGKSVDEVLKAGALSAVLAIPGGAIGSGNTKKLILGSLAAYGTAFAGAYASGESTEDALKAASIAMITHLSASKLGHATDAALAKGGARVGKAVKNTAINTTAAIAIGTARALPHPSFEGPRAGFHDTTMSVRGPAAERMPTPDAAHQTIAQGGVTNAPPPGTPRYIPPTLPSPAAPGVFVPPEPKFLPPRRHVGGFTGESRSTLRDPRVHTVAGFKRAFQASVPLSEVPDVPAPARTRRIGGFVGKSEPPVPYDPNAILPASRRVSGFARDAQRFQWGSEVPEVPAERWRRIGGFARQGEAAVPHDPYGPRFLRDPSMKDQAVEVDGFGRGRGAPESHSEYDVDESSNTPTEPPNGGGGRPPGPRAAPGSRLMPMHEADTLRQLAALVLRRPVEELYGVVHVYTDQAEFEAEVVFSNPRRPDPENAIAFRRQEDNTIHLGPSAGLIDQLHEVIHLVRQSTFEGTRILIGSFLDEGVTEMLAQRRSGLTRSMYTRNIQFVEHLEKLIGPDALEVAVVHGEYAPFRRAVARLFDDNPRATNLFLSALRSIGPRMQNPEAYGLALRILSNAGHSMGPLTPPPIPRGGNRGGRGGPSGAPAAQTKTPIEITIEADEPPLPGRTAPEAAAPSQETKKPLPPLSPAAISMEKADKFRRFATLAFRRPIPELYGVMHQYDDPHEFMALLQKLNPFDPTPEQTAAVTDNERGHVHLGPNARLTDAAHELIHYLRRGTQPATLATIGGFLDEGITEWIVIERVGAPESATYERNVAFTRRLAPLVGPEVLANVVLHGELRTFRAALDRYFQGRTQATQRFLHALRSIGDTGDNAAELAVAEHLLDSAGAGPIPPLPESASPPRE